MHSTLLSAICLIDRVCRTEAVVHLAGTGRFSAPGHSLGLESPAGPRHSTWAPTLPSTPVRSKKFISSRPTAKQPTLFLKHRVFSCECSDVRSMVKVALALWSVA